MVKSIPSYDITSSSYLSTRSQTLWRRMISLHGHLLHTMPSQSGTKL